MYEKALDALATSPVARGVNRWLLAGDRDTNICSALRRKELCRVLLALRDHLQCLMKQRTDCPAHTILLAMKAGTGWL